MSHPTTWGVPRTEGDPAETPEDYAIRDDDSLDALLSSHIGSSRPGYAVAGTFWIDNTATPWVLYFFDGTDDIEIQKINHSQNAVQWRWYKGADVASAAALALGKDGNYFDITGTTAITSIGTLGIGTVVTLQFDAVLTLTHHATDLVLPGGADIVTATGDHALFMEFAAGDWRCIGYTRAAIGPHGSTLLETQTVSSGVAAVDFDLPAGYTDYILTVDNLRPATDDDELAIRISQDGGSSFLSGASDYKYVVHSAGAGGVEFNTGTATLIRFNSAAVGWGIGNATDEIHSYVIGLIRPGASGAPKLITSNGYYTTISSNLAMTTGAAHAVGGSGAAYDAVRLLCVAGNINQGTFRLFGRR